MTIMETLAGITPMLYASIILLPVALYGYLSTGRPRRPVAAAAAIPGDQLKEKPANQKREMANGFFLGACLAFAVATLIFVYGIVGDYKASKGIFATPLPAATYPPSPAFALPDEPKFDESGALVGGNKVIEPKKKNSVIPN